MKSLPALHKVTWLHPNSFKVTLESYKEANCILSNLISEARRGSCICQTWQKLPRNEFWSSEDGQNIIVHPMYSSNNVDTLSLDVWGSDYVLQPSTQEHVIIFHFAGRGSCICQTWKGSFQVEFWSSEALPSRHCVCICMCSSICIYDNLPSLQCIFLSYMKKSTAIGKDHRRFFSSTVIFFVCMKMKVHTHTKMYTTILQGWRLLCIPMGLYSYLQDR